MRAHARSRTESSAAVSDSVAARRRPLAARAPTRRGGRAAVSSRRPAHSNAHGSSDKPAVEHPRIAWDKALGIAKSGAAACEAMVRTLGAWREAAAIQSKTLTELDSHHVVTEDHSLRVAAAGLQRTLRVHAAGATRFAATIQLQCLPSLQRCLGEASREVKNHEARKAAVGHAAGQRAGRRAEGAARVRL